LSLVFAWLSGSLILITESITIELLQVIHRFVYTNTVTTDEVKLRYILSDAILFVSISKPVVKNLGDMPLSRFFSEVVWSYYLLLTIRAHSCLYSLYVLIIFLITCNYSNKCCYNFILTSNVLTKAFLNKLAATM
jgi:hypothetical protein